MLDSQYNYAKPLYSQGFSYPSFPYIDCSSAPSPPHDSLAQSSLLATHGTS